MKKSSYKNEEIKSCKRKSMFYNQLLLKVKIVGNKSKGC